MKKKLGILIIIVILLGAAGAMLPLSNLVIPLPASKLATVKAENPVAAKALQVLEQADTRLAQVVEMRYFGGLSETEIAEVLGHKTMAMAKRYSHLTQKHLGSVVANMNQRLKVKPQ